VVPQRAPRRPRRGSPSSPKTRFRRAYRSCQLVVRRAD
jgi:hypothetical protein